MLVLSMDTIAVDDSAVVAVEAGWSNVDVAAADDAENDAVAVAADDDDGHLWLHLGGWKVMLYWLICLLPLWLSRSYVGPWPMAGLRKTMLMQRRNKRLLMGRTMWPLLNL